MVGHWQTIEREPSKIKLARLERERNVVQCEVAHDDGALDLGRELEIRHWLPRENIVEGHRDAHDGSTVLKSAGGPRLAFSGTRQLQPSSDHWPFAPPQQSRYPSRHPRVSWFEF
ncbi:hypothetical protein [Paraburkholderia humisilvae]|uniref:Uncharacterized protein n=1 Tax=Paraburkholderia humisilvae TaxID=627669 RepID=A0A6J5EZB4_9BURK|nr:hypothetical protein [Paraburkholderia humisilvae]CAB3770777.1 hypothetical protein LMG29542_06439 [Paraburkholderia humisilvae]